MRNWIKNLLMKFGLVHVELVHPREYGFLVEPGDNLLVIDEFFVVNNGSTRFYICADVDKERKAS